MLHSRMSNFMKNYLYFSPKFCIPTSYLAITESLFTKIRKIVIIHVRWL